MSIAHTAYNNVSNFNVFHGRRRKFKNNKAIVDKLSASVKSASCVDVFSSSGAKIGRASYDGFNDYRNHDYVPPSLYFLAQLKDIDLSIFSAKELLVLGVLCESIEYTFPPLDRELFSFIKKIVMA